MSRLGMSDKAPFKLFDRVRINDDEMSSRVWTIIDIDESAHDITIGSTGENHRSFGWQTASYVLTPVEG